MFVGGEGVPVLRTSPVGRGARRRAFVDMGKLALHAQLSSMELVSSETLFADRHYRGRQPVDLGAVVADVEDRELQLVADAFDHRHDVAAPRRVERRERFVHKQAFGGREQRAADRAPLRLAARSEEHTSELQSLMRNSYAVFCLKKQNTTTT